MTDCGGFKRTQPRGPVAAMYNSPGPSYLLPTLVGKTNHDPRSVHDCRPAYHFGNKHISDKLDSSPGPCYLINSNMTNTGQDGTPKYSLYSRPKASANDSTPGAGAYNTDTADTVRYTKPAAYSIKGRHKDYSLFGTPGPNAYQPDPMLGKVCRSNKRTQPNYSITGRSKVGGFHEDLQKTPGPGSYATVKPQVYRNKNPEYSLASRHIPPGDNSKIPSPQAYNVEGQRRSKGPSFGIRHSQYIGTMIVPADDAC